MSEAGRITGRRSGRSSSGFTLIELLAVVAIVLILIAFLAPMMSKLRDRPNDSRCLALLKIFAQGYSCYIFDQGQALIEHPWGNCYPYNQHYPSQDGDSPDIPIILRPYVPYRWLEPRSVNSATRNGQNWPADEGINYWWDYGYPAYGPHNRTGPSVTGNGAYWGIGSYPVHLQEIPSPSTTATFMCSKAISTNGVFRGGFYIANSGYMPWAMHNGYTALNVAKLDGSVREYPYFEVVTPGTQMLYGPQRSLQSMDPCDPAIPAAYRGKGIPARGYLWNGYNPGSRPEAGWKTD